MNYHIITFGKRKENLIISIEKKIIGSSHTTVQKYIKSGSAIFLHYNSYLWARAKVSSNYFISKKKIWLDNLYPNRFQIDEITLTNDPVCLTNGIYNRRLREQFGAGWAYKFLFTPKPLPQEVGLKIHSDFSKRKPLAVDEFLKECSSYLQ